MALIQTTVDDDVKARADAVFSRSGLTSAMAMRVMITQVANSGSALSMGCSAPPHHAYIQAISGLPCFAKKPLRQGLFQMTHSMQRKCLKKSSIC